MIKDEFENTKVFFLIINLDIKTKNKYSFLFLDKKLVIISEEYKDSFESFEIEKGVYLINEVNYLNFSMPFRT